MWRGYTIVGHWKDKRIVMYVSTEFSNDLVTFTNKRGEE